MQDIALTADTASLPCGQAESGPHRQRTRQVRVRHPTRCSEKTAFSSCFIKCRMFSMGNSFPVSAGRMRLRSYSKYSMTRCGTEPSGARPAGGRWTAPVKTTAPMPLPRTNVCRTRVAGHVQQLHNVVAYDLAVRVAPLGHAPQHLDLSDSRDGELAPFPDGDRQRLASGVSAATARASCERPAPLGHTSCLSSFLRRFMATTWFVRLSRALYTTLRAGSHLAAAAAAAGAGHVSRFHHGRAPRCAPTHP